jgi:hypothetical protein
MAEICRQYEVPEATMRRCNANYGKLNRDLAKEPKSLCLPTVKMVSGRSGWPGLLPSKKANGILSL